MGGDFQHVVHLSSFSHFLNSIKMHICDVIHPTPPYNLHMCLSYLLFFSMFHNNRLLSIFSCSFLIIYLSHNNYFENKLLIIDKGKY